MREWEELPVVNQKTLARQGGSLGDAFPPILRGFADGLPERLEGVEQAFRGEDVVALEHAVHKLRGAAMTFGADRVAMIASMILAPARAGRIPPPEADLLEALRVEMVAVQLKLAADLAGFPHE